MILRSGFCAIYCKLPKPTPNTTCTSAHHAPLYNSAGLNTVHVNKWRRKCAALAASPASATVWNAVEYTTYRRQGEAVPAASSAGVAAGRRDGAAAAQKTGPAKLARKARRATRGAW